MSVLPAALFEQLGAVGLNLHGVLRLADLPPHVRDAVRQAAPSFGETAVLWVVGHQGPAMWQHLCALWGEAWSTAGSCVHPIDSWARETVSRALAARALRYRCLFPGPDAPAGVLPLQQLGQALGWHHRSPFQVGIDAEWGSWFAYRAVCVVDASGPVSAPRLRAHACASCATRACEAACPVDALRPVWRMQACMDHRLSADSSCAQTCLARQACPVGVAHAYTPAQLAYHYGQSLAFMAQWARTSGGEP